MKELYLTKGGERMAIATNDRVWFGSDGKVCTIGFDPCVFSPDHTVVDEAAKAIADQGLDVEIVDERFHEGILTLLIGQIKSVGNAIFVLMEQIRAKIEACIASATPATAAI